MRRKLLLCVGAAGIVVAGIMPSAATTKTVTIPARRYDPEKVTIFVGDTVRWVNTDDRKHSVTATSSTKAKGESFDSNPGCTSFIFSSCMTRGDTYSHTFTHSGVFTYYCRIHGSDTSFADCDMCGQVVVKKKGGATTPTGSPSIPPSSSPTTSVSASPTETVSGSPSASATETGRAIGPPSDDDGTRLTIAIASAALVVLAGSGLLVYRTLLRR